MIFTCCRCHVTGITFALLVIVACVVWKGVPDGDTDRKTIETGKRIDMTFYSGSHHSGPLCKTGTSMLAD